MFRHSIHIPVVFFLLMTVFFSCSSKREVANNETRVSREAQTGAARAATPAGIPEEPEENAEQAESAEAEARRAAQVRSVDESEAAYLDRTNKALTHLVLAQLALEDNMPNLALYEINRSLYFLETADALALKGSIFYLLGNLSEARSFWRSAYNLNPDAIHDFLPGIPEAFTR